MNSKPNNLRAEIGRLLIEFMIEKIKKERANEEQGNRNNTQGSDKRRPDNVRPTGSFRKIEQEVVSQE